MQKKYAVFTMDVEAFTDTECVAKSSEHVDVDLLDGFDEYIRILDKHNIRSTLFNVGTLAPKMAEKLQSCIANGHRVALHNYEHVAPMDQSPDTFRRGVGKAKKHLSELFGTEIEGFRAPFFSMDNQRLNILKELGFRYDSSHLDYSPARHTVRMKLPDYRKIRKNIFRKNGFYEFGLAKERVFGWDFPISGGGYVRLSNWGFIKTLITHYIRRHDYYVFYLHPFELTRQKIPFLKELKNYDKYYTQRGIRHYNRRVERIIRMLLKNGYEFVTFEKLTQIMEAESLPVTTIS
jgi:peptidoglycan/xylan/chitin deacetylase (PgdA/CDA1 family)